MRHARVLLGSLVFPEEFMKIGFSWEVTVLAERAKWMDEEPKKWYCCRLHRLENWPQFGDGEQGGHLGRPSVSCERAF